MGLSLPHLIVLALVVLLLFGRGKISELMGDFGKGIKSFKHGINDETVQQPIATPAQLAAPPHPEVVPHGQPVAAQAAAAQPMLNGEPVDQQVQR